SCRPARSPLRRCAASAASGTSRTADSGRYTGRRARPGSSPRPPRPRTRRSVLSSSSVSSLDLARENPAVVVECLELQRIAARIADEECRLLAGLAFKSYVRRDREGNFFARQFVGKRAPLRHGQNHAEMPHGHLFPVNNIKRFAAILIRA